MSDLARQAAETIVVSGDIEADEEKTIQDALDVINSVGTLVSHEDAALLREMWRGLASGAKMTIEGQRGGLLSVDVLSADGLMRAMGIGDDATAALKSALDAAGVPDSAAQMGEQA